jgi:hypothetical protein
MAIMYINNGEITLNKQSALKLELALNLKDISRKYVSIGDELYAFYISSDTKDVYVTLPTDVVKMLRSLLD